jgi:hypothetical protein
LLDQEHGGVPKHRSEVLGDENHARWSERLIGQRGRPLAQHVLELGCGQVAPASSAVGLGEQVKVEPACHRGVVERLDEHGVGSDVALQLGDDEPPRAI